MILPQTVLLTEVIKRHQEWHLVDVTRRVVFGTAEAVAGRHRGRYDVTISLIF